MLAVAERTGDASTAMWGRLWRIDALVEDGRITEAADELGPLAAAVERVGGPVSAWHRDRVDGVRRPRAGPLRRRPGGGPARLRADAGDRAVTGDGRLPRHGVGARPPRRTVRRGRRAGPRSWVEPPPRFRTMGRVSRAYLLLAGRSRRRGGGQFRQAGPPEAWSWPVFFVAPGSVLAALVAIGLDRTDELAAALEGLEPFRGQHDRRQRRELLRAGRAHPRARCTRAGPPRRRRRRSRRRRPDVRPLRAPPPTSPRRCTTRRRRWPRGPRPATGSAHAGWPGRATGSCARSG